MLLTPTILIHLTIKVENYAAHPDYVDKLNWYLLPSANPDG